ncbi:MAG: hypothetical protein M5U22_18455 [Thermoleophilia bacterium]|nr:hypothetical protein [Thermoleophilia bacterium]
MLERAKKALAEAVGGPLGIDEHAAAAKVAEVAADLVADDVRRALATLHAEAPDQVLFAFGGTGASRPRVWPRRRTSGRSWSSRWARC